MSDANASEGDGKPTNAPKRRSKWLLLIAVGAMLGFLALHVLRTSTPAAPALTGKLNVLVRPPNRSLEPIGVDQPGALPVQSGGAMCLDVHLNEPAYVYLVWIEAGGEIRPLYPWNNESLEVKDIYEPPPERRPGKLVFSPLLGKSWTFGDKAGTETVLALVRKSGPPQNTPIGDLLKSLPPLPSLESTQVLRTAQAMKSAASPDSAKTSSGDISNSPLEEYLQPLTAHFDLVQAVQFGHADGSEK